MKSDFIFVRLVIPKSVISLKVKTELFRQGSNWYTLSVTGNLLVKEFMAGMIVCQKWNSLYGELSMLVGRVKVLVSV